MPVPELDSQLRDYFDHVVERFDADELPEMLHGEPPQPLIQQSSRARPGWVIAAAAAIITLLLVGGSNVLFDAMQSTPADESPTKTDNTATTETSIATTTEVVVAPTTIDQVTVDVAASIVPGLGTLTWERVEGDADTLPTGIQADANGGYVSYEGTKVWRSQDAVTWVSEEVAPELAGFRWVSFHDGWAIGSDESGNELFEQVDDSWVAVDLDPAPLPEIAGIDWQQWIRSPISAEGILVIDGTAWGEVSWSDYYGVFEVDCGEPEPCELEPYAMWDPPSGAFRLDDPERGTTLAVLKATIDGEQISFSDATSGELVHQIVGTAEYPAELILAQLKRGGGLTSSGVWASKLGGDFSWVTTPWQAPADLVVVPDGGFAAYEFVYDWQANPEAPLVSARVWTSQDAVEWIDQGEPAFVDFSSEHSMVQAGSQHLRATVITGYNNSTGEELAYTYVSTDGIGWTEVESVFPPWVTEEETDFGLVVTAMPQSTHLFWVSTDGSTWHEVAGPPGSHEPAGAGFAGSGAAGSILFTSVGEDAGQRSLWIGRFEQTP